MRSSTRNTSPCSISSNQENSLNGSRRTRRRLQERFERICECNSSATTSTGGSCLADVDRGEKPWASFALPTLTKTLNTVQTTFDTLSQKFRRSTKRRQQLKNEPSPRSPTTPQARSRRLLGRTPTKLYSPFGIESPRRPLRDADARNESEDWKQRSNKQVEYLGSSCGSKSPQSVTVNRALVMGNKIFDPDMEEVRIGIWELRQTAHCIVKRSSLQN